MKPKSQRAIPGKAPGRMNAKPEANDPYAEGADAATAGEPQGDNPYQRGSEEFISWNEGWTSIAHDQTVE